MPCLSHVLTVAGGLAEVGGLGLVIAEIIKVQRREIPEHRGWVLRSLAAMRVAGGVLADEVGRLLRREPERRDATVHAVSAGAAVAAGSNITATVIKGAAPTLARRVERIEAELRRLDEQAAADRNEMRSETREAKSRIDTAEREVKAMIEERDRQRREGVRAALSLQKIGVAAFIFGVGLSSRASTSRA